MSESLEDRAGPLDELSLEEVLELARRHARVTASPETPATLEAAEKAHGVRLDVQHRAFLLRHGSLQIVGAANRKGGYLEVFGSATFEDARRFLRRECDSHASYRGPGLDEPRWLELRYTPVDAPEVQREELRERLGLDDATLSVVLGDTLDELRIAHRFMLPVVQRTDEIHQGVECVGPDGRLFRVTIKSHELELGGPFDDVLREALARLIVD